MSQKSGQVVIMNVTCDDVGDRVPCPNCFKQYSCKQSLANHLRNKTCSVIKDQEKIKVLTDQILKQLSNQMAEQVALSVSQQTSQLADQVAQIGQEVQQMKTARPSVKKYVHNHHQNDTKNLNVMCLGSKDNLLDILTNQSSFPLALTFIKNSALGKLAGDCRILESVYMPLGQRPAIMYRNKTKNQYVYYDEDNERQIESNPAVLAKKLADILQRSYLKGMDSLKTDLCGETRRCKLPKKLQKDIPEVEAYDLHLWNEHIHQLNDEKYQKQVLKSLKICVEKDVPD
jgi:hypothetical protein